MAELTYQVVSDGSDYAEKKEAVIKAILELMDAQIGALVDGGQKEDEGALRAMVMGRMGLNFEFGMTFPDHVSGSPVGEYQPKFNIDPLGTYAAAVRKAAH